MRACCRAAACPLTHVRAGWHGHQGSATCFWGCSVYKWCGLGAAWYRGGTDCSGCAPDDFDFRAGFASDVEIHENARMREQAAASRTLDCPVTTLALKNKWRISNAAPTHGNPRVREVHLFADPECSERVALPRTGVTASGVSDSEEESHRVYDLAVDGEESTSWAP